MKGKRKMRREARIQQIIHEKSEDNVPTPDPNPKLPAFKREEDLVKAIIAALPSEGTLTTGEICEKIGIAPSRLLLANKSYTIATYMPNLISRKLVERTKDGSRSLYRKLEVHTVDTPKVSHGPAGCVSCGTTSVNHFTYCAMQPPEPVSTFTPADHGSIALKGTTEFKLQTSGDLDKFKAQNPNGSSFINANPASFPMLSGRQANLVAMDEVATFQEVKETQEPAQESADTPTPSEENNPVVTTMATTDAPDSLDAMIQAQLDEIVAAKRREMDSLVAVQLGLTLAKEAIAPLKAALDEAQRAYDAGAAKYQQLLAEAQKLLTPQQDAAPATLPSYEGIVFNGQWFNQWLNQIATILVKTNNAIRENNRDVTYERVKSRARYELSVASKHTGVQLGTKKITELTEQEVLEYGLKVGRSIESFFINHAKGYTPTEFYSIAEAKLNVRV